MGPEAEPAKRSLRERFKDWRQARQPQISGGHHYADRAAAQTMRKAIDEAQTDSADKTPADNKNDESEETDSEAGSQ